MLEKSETLAGQLVALRSVSNNALKSDQLPTRLKLLDWGSNQSTVGAVILDDQSAQLFAANQKLIGRERIPLDFEHNTVPGTEEFKRSQEPRDVAAYGAPVVIPGEGLWLEGITWTPAGLKSARNYEDLSPAPFRTAEGRVIGLHSAALTRAGAVTGLHFFSASPELDRMVVTLSAGSSADRSQLNKNKMQTHTIETLAAQVAALETRLAGLTAAAPIDLTPLTARLAAFERRFETSEREQLLTAATRDGKVIPLKPEEMLTVPIVTLRALITNLPSIVPLSARGRVVETPMTVAPNRKAQIDAAVAKHRQATNCDYDTAFNAVRSAEPALFN